MYDEAQYNELSSFGWKTKSDGLFLSASEETELWRDWQQNGNEASRQKVIESHIPLCWKMSLDFAKGNTKISRLDFFGEACLAMTAVADRFDPERNVRFSSFIEPWIKSYLLDLNIQASGPIKMATTKLERYVHFNFFKIQDEVLGDDPSRNNYRKASLMAEWIAQNKFRPAEGASKDEVREHLDRIRKAVEKNEALRDSCHISLDVPLGKDNEGNEGETLLHMIAGDSRAEKNLEEEDYMRTLSALAEGFNKLSPRSQDILRSRIMNLDGPVPTLHDLGEKYGVSCERIRQIEAEAIKKLRQHISSADLPDRPTPDKKLKLNF